MKKKYNLSIFEKHFLNFGCYITFLIFLTFVFTTSLVAQENPKLESRLVFSKQAGAQSYLKIEGAQVFSIFKFSTKIDNPNLTSEDTPTYAHTSVSAFGIGYERVKSNGLLILGGLGMRKAGSSLIYKKIDYLWKMQYIDVKAGIGYQVNKWPIKPYAAVLPYFAYLYNAKQSIGTNSYDIKASGSFKNSDFGMFMALGFKAGISPYISIYSEYNYILGLQNIETGNEQYLYNRGFSFKLGIALTLSSYTTHKEDVIQTPTDFLAPESAYLVDKPPVKNTPPVLEKKAEVPVIETMTEPREEELKSVNKNASQALSNNTIPVKNEPIIENQSKSAEKKLEITKEPLKNVALDKKDPVIEKKSKEGAVLESVKTTSSDDSKKPPSVIKNTAKEDSKNNNNDNGSAKNKLEKNPVAPVRMPVKILFKIQIASVSKPLGINHPLLKSISGKIEKETGKNGKIIYYSGIFESYDEARSFLSIIKAKGGNEGAFVVAFKNGKQITVYEAKKLIEKNQ